MSLLITGERQSGNEVRKMNAVACISVANTVKSSFGPEGLDKMIVDDVGEAIVTNDGATIVEKLKIDHPAARVLVDISQNQDSEVGDGTTSVVILGAELIKAGTELITQGIHSTVVIRGYRIATKEAIKYCKSNLLVPSKTLTDEILMNVARTSMSSKIIGPDSEFFGRLVVDSLKKVAYVDADGKNHFPLKAVKILKCHGKSVKDSTLVDGFALNCTRCSQQMPKFVENAKIALLDFDLKRHKTQMGVEFLISDPDELQKISRREEDITRERIDKLIDAGANVIMTSKGIDDLCAKFLVDRGVMGVRRVKPSDLSAIAKCTGGSIISTLADVEGGESVDVSNYGEAAGVGEERVGDGELIYIRGAATDRSTTIVLRGANEFVLEEVHRSLHDSLSVTQRVLQNKTLVVGGGAVEAALSVHLDEFATTLGSREQAAVKAFAQTLLVVPKTLVMNAAYDATDLTSKLCARHYRAQHDDTYESDKFCGLDLSCGKIINNQVKGVLEPALLKIKSFRFATEAAIAVLRIDDHIKVEPEQQQQQQGGAPGGGMMM